MPLRSLLRISPAIWLSPLLVILALLATNIVSTTADPYALAHASVGAYTVFLIAPFCAACGAWEGGRLLRARWTNLAHARSPLWIAIHAVGLTLGVGIVAIIVAILARLLSAGILAIPDLRIVGMVTIVIVAHTLLGFAIGIHVSPVIAVPATFLIDYGWMVLPVAIEPLWVRHLNGALASCCLLSDVLAPQAFTGPIIVAIGLAGTAVLLLGRTLNRIRLGIAIIPTLAALIFGAFQVRTFGVDPVVDRVAPMACSSSTPRVCVWPEHRARLEEVTRIAVDAATRWRAIGINVPTEFNERNPDLLPEDAKSFGFTLASQPLDIINSLAYSLTPPFPACADKGTFYGGGTKAFLTAWFASVAGMSDADIEARYDPDTIRTVTAVRALPLDQQRIWVQNSLDVMESCDRLPAAVPGL